jgi:2-polyprenyl-6-methoxyphenol hydroxylase-like FAD-dependent oxidoreductase
MSAISSALVIGGGIGGLTAAVALRQAGVAVTLVEAKPDFSVYGVGIIQPNNTLRALDKVGLARACVERGAPFPGWRIHDVTGNFLMAATNGSSAAPDFPPNNGITRPDLQRILSDAAYAHDVDVRLGTKVARLDEHDDGVDAILTDGNEHRFDLVIGCDGVYSETRKLLFGDQVSPQFTGQGVWRYNFPRPSYVEWGEIHAGARSKVGLVPMRPDLMYMFIVTAEPGNPWFADDQLADLMRDRLDGFTGIVGELREKIIDPAGVVYKPMENLMLPKPWNRGRIVIIGDAAHATTPHLAQGAAMAIEDAVLLGELMRRDEPVASLLRDFVDRRFDRAKFVVDSSHQIALWEMESWDGIQNPDARPGELLHEASVALLEEY